jgi:hypothetical protein
MGGGLTKYAQISPPTGSWAAAPETPAKTEKAGETGEIQ